MRKRWRQFKAKEERREWNQKVAKQGEMKKKKKRRQSKRATIN